MIVYFDALFVKSREEGSTRAVYVALAIDIEGEKKVLGLWIAPTEGAVSWLAIFGELKARGMEDCFIACVDGLLPEAIERSFHCAGAVVRGALRKLLYLGLREASKKWKRPIRDWKAALNQFVILYGDRVPIEQ